MKAVRLLAAAFLIAFAIWIAWIWIWVPLACDAFVTSRTNAAYEDYEQRSEEARARAEETLVRIAPCLSPVCRTTAAVFLAAISERTLGRHEAALARYREMLTWDERPEVYANIADTQLALGDREGAYASYLAAALFFPRYIDAIDDPAMKVRVREEVLRRHPDWKERLERPMRAIPGF